MALGCKEDASRSGWTSEDASGNGRACFECVPVVCRVKFTPLNLSFKMTPTLFPINTMCFQVVELLSDPEIPESHTLDLPYSVSSTPWAG